MEKGSPREWVLERLNLGYRKGEAHRAGWVMSDANTGRYGKVREKSECVCSISRAVLFVPFGPSEADYAVKGDQSNTKAVSFASEYYTYFC